jgi:nucleoside-diphosphate-sugar epimerase
MTLSAFMTGATGFVGAHLARELALNGWSVTALVRKNSPLGELDGLDIELRQGDVMDAESVREAMPPTVDAVFHVAASTNVWKRQNESQTRVNIDGTRNVIRACEQRQAGRLIHTSSFIVWGFQQGRLTEKNARLDNADWINYVRTKWAAEELIDAAATRGLDTVIMNPAHILGPGDRHNWSRMIRLVDTGKLPGIPSGGGAFSDVREVARAHVQAFHHGRPGQRYLLGGENIAFLELVRMTGEILGRKVPARASPAWLLRAMARLYETRSMLSKKEPDLTPESAAMITQHIDCDSSRAQRELNYRFTPPRDLLLDTISWMRENGMLSEQA